MTSYSSLVPNPKSPISNLKCPTVHFIPNFVFKFSSIPVPPCLKIPTTPYAPAPLPLTPYPLPPMPPYRLPQEEASARPLPGGAQLTVAGLKTGQGPDRRPPKVDKTTAIFSIVLVPRLGAKGWKKLINKLIFNAPTVQC